MSVRSRWILNRLVLYARLMRLDKPIGIMLLLWPTLWGLVFASPDYQDMTVLVIYGLGTVLMRSAGCVINDYADRNFDPYVQRTATRPLATQALRPAEALGLAGILALMAFGLVLMLNPLTIGLSFVALAVAVSYPYTKRFFPLPQAYLGVAFGFAIPMAFATYQNTVPGLAWVLWMANVFWAIAYDTEYAMVDRDDDIPLKLHSSALLFGRFEVLAIMLCHVVFLLMMAGAGWWMRWGLGYFLGLTVAAGLIGLQYRWIKTREPKRCFEAFLNNHWVGAAIFLGLLWDRWGLIQNLRV